MCQPNKTTNKVRPYIKTGYVRDCDSKRIDGIQVYTVKMSVGRVTKQTTTTTKTKTTTNVSSSTTKKQHYRGSILKTWLYERIQSLRLYTLFFCVLYLYQGLIVYRSQGVPYREFLIKADVEGFQIMEGSARYQAELRYALQDINNVERRTTKLSWTAWMDMDIEELAEAKKREKEKNVLDSLPKHMRVPGKNQTSFWPTLLLGVLCTLHALLLLLQHWSVRFNILMNYNEINVDHVIDEMHKVVPMDISNDDNEHFTHSQSTASSTTSNGDGASSTTSGSSTSNITNSGNKYQLDSSGNCIVFPDQEVTNNLPSSLPTHAQIIPSKMGEKDVLVPIQYYPTLGMTIEYHRRKYVYNVDEKMWIKIRCRTDVPLHFLSTWVGFPMVSQIITAQIRFGPNLFKVKQPTFIELYQAQLLNPFSVFQIFCVLLWAIDDYIVYSLFSLFMVLMFEGTVVFQRIQSLKSLQSMGNPSRTMYVYRSYQWVPIDSAALLPGDIISLTLHKPNKKKKHINPADDNRTSNDNKKASAIVNEIMNIKDEGGDVVPADLLLLRGATVVNEASLTGESVPQMKEGLTELVVVDSGDNNNNTTENNTLSMKGRHKMNVVYAGTTMLQCQGTSTNSNNNNNGDTGSTSTSNNLFQHIPHPPDDGCTCFVLRTGFASAQGKLVRMIEGSQEKVKGHEKETGLLLGLLCIFAILSSSYVLYHGMQNKNRSKYELLLHCILIVTSVIRPELPMQMALAVNNSLMTLMKLHIFCTEPYRVPIAGKLNSCLFDKTGTLTTDELVAVGVCEPNQLPTILSAVTTTTTSSENKEKNSNNKQQQQTATTDTKDNSIFTHISKLSTSEASLVLAGCHSLVVYDDETTGDPLESASLKAMKWHISVTTGHAEPIPPKENKPSTSGGQPILLLKQQSEPITSVSILTRHHFSSKLQRMSCVIQTGTGGTANKAGGKFAVAKGSPEAIGNLLETKPLGYDVASEFLSKQGYRVIGLAYKPLVTPLDVTKAIETRAACEANLIFAGFIAFTCMVRKDTADVLKRLKEGGMSVAMITGDALLTAIHVAKEVNIVSEPLSSTTDTSGTTEQEIDPELEKNEELRKLIEEKRGRPIVPLSTKKTNNLKDDGTTKPIAYLDQSDTGSLYWRSYTDGTKVEDFQAKEIPRLSTQYDLATTGKCLAQALEEDTYTRKVLAYVKVFARMTPDAKETVIEALHSVNLLCLMCGDGANDVGALKQADIGVALLSGFGNINVAKDSNVGEGAEVDKELATKEKNEPPVTAIISKEHLEQVRALPVALIKMKIKQLGTDPSRYPEIVEKEDLIKLYQIKAREVAIKRHDEKNELAKKNMSKQEQAAEKRKLIVEKQRKMEERVRELESQGVSFATFRAMKEFTAAEMAESKKRANKTHGRGIEGQAAALAAQLDAAGGDGALDEATGMPMVKLGDASIAAPFTSKMPSIRSCVDIVRQGRCTLVSSMQMYQIMALQCLISSYSLSVLYLDGVKYGDTQMTAMGLLGTVSFMSVSRSKPLDKLSRVQPLSSIFHPASFFSLLGQFAIHLTTMVLAVQAAKKHLPPDWEVDLDGMFKPGILNTVVFLISSVQQVTVFFVNLQGRPFMTGVTENRPLLWSLISTFILTFMFASETVPGLNRYFQLIPFPDEAFRDYILIILGMDLVATFLFDRLMKYIFAREILKASIEGTTMKDVWSILKTFLMLGFLMYNFIGNSDTWDQLLAMELGEFPNGTTTLLGDNSTTSNSNSSIEFGMVENDSTNNSTSECLNGICNVLKATLVTTAVKVIPKVYYADDEF